MRVRSRRDFVAAGVGSAFGLMLAPISFDFSRSYVVRLADLDMERLRQVFCELEEEGRKIVVAGGVGAHEISVRRTADMRYAGQGHEIRVNLPEGALEESSREGLYHAFEGEYRRIYGRICPGVPVETVHWRVTVSGPQPTVKEVRTVQQSIGKEAKKGYRPAFFEGADEPKETAVYDRYALESGFVVSGPAIVEEEEATTIVPPNWRLKVHGSGSLVLFRMG